MIFWGFDFFNFFLPPSAIVDVVIAVGLVVRDFNNVMITNDCHPRAWR